MSDWIALPDGRVWPSHIFSGKIKIDNLWKDSQDYKGGITGTDFYGKEYGAGVFKVRIKGQDRNLAFIVYDSENLKNDVEVLKGFVKFYYDI